MIPDQITGRQAYRQEFRTPPQSTTPLVRPAPTKAIRICMVGLALMALVGLLTSLPRGHSPSSPMPSASTPAPTPAPTPAQVVVPRAQPVEGPLTSVGTPMLSGSQYYVAMPDGRHLLVNYKGWVDHACNLPRQHGINNAAYTEAATGYTWIWTVPAGTSNVPQWLDP